VPISLFEPVIVIEAKAFEDILNTVDVKDMSPQEAVLHAFQKLLLHSRPEIRLMGSVMAPKKSTADRPEIRPITPSTDES
jgi:hypothetical protein